ncbi:MAG: inner membrane protein YbjM [Symbiopectobacterium sp.]
MDVFSVTETGFRREPGMLLFLLPGIVASCL